MAPKRAPLAIDWTILAVNVNVRDARSDGNDEARLNRDGVNNAGHNKRKNKDPE